MRLGLTASMRAGRLTYSPFDLRLTRYTTANPENLDQDFQGTDFKAPMAGFGECIGPGTQTSAQVQSHRLWTTDRPTLFSILWRLPQADFNGRVSCERRCRSGSPQTDGAAQLWHRLLHSLVTPVQIVGASSSESERLVRQQHSLTPLSVSSETDVDDAFSPHDL